MPNPIPMKLTLYLTCCTLFLFNIIAVNAQTTQQKGGVPSSDYLSNFTPKSPQQAALGSFGNVPINFFTGLPEISLNLLTLTSRDLTLPISINYDASGVRLEDIAGPVGLNWNFDGISFVGRSLNSLPDEDPNLGYFKWRSDINATTIDFTGWTPLSESNTRDCEPDEFVVFINGRSIRFVIDSNNGIGVPIPKQDVLITYSLDASKKLYQFTVTTEDGIKYTFGGTANSVEERKVDNLSMACYYYYDQNADYYSKTYIDGTTYTYDHEIAEAFYAGNEKLGSATVTEKLGTAYNSKWYLISIVSPTTDQITFDYTKLTDNKYVNKPTFVRRKPVLFNVPDFTYTESVCVKSWFGVCSDNQNRTFSHLDWDTPAYAAFPKREATTSELGTPVLQNGDYYSPVNFQVKTDGLFINQPFITESVIRLNKITTSVGNTVYFVSSQRTDFPNLFKYDRIYLTGVSGTIVKDITLNYSTLGGTDYGYRWPTEQWGGQDAIKGDVLSKYSSETDSDSNHKRLFLENVQQTVNGMQKTLYTFNYNHRELLDRRTSNNQTCLGLQTKTTFQFDTENPSLNIEPAQSRYTLAKLSELIYQTGGKTEFNYDPASGQLKTMIDRNEAGDIASQKELLVQEPFTLSVPIVEATQYTVMNDPDHKDFSAALSNKASYIQNRSFALTHGVYNANKKIRVYNGTSTAHDGYEDFVFTTNSDIKTQVYASPQDVDASNNPMESSTDNIFPFPKNQEREYLRGLLDEHTVYDRANQPVTYEKNYYTINDANAYQPFTLLGFVGGSYSMGSGPKKTRYARYKICADKVYKTKTVSKVYDQSVPRDLTKVLSKVDIYNYQGSGLVSYTSTYNEQNPSSKVDTYTSYVTDPAFANTSSSPTASAQAIVDMRNKHQVNVPVEKKTFYVEGTQSVQGSTVVYKYATTSSIVKPYQVLGLAKPSSTYITPKIDNGTFVIDPNLRVLHTYDSYDSKGNILLQTALDGTVTKYIWDSYNQVSNSIINPGTDQQGNLYGYRQLIGISSITDPNAVKTFYEYDGTNRLTVSKDNNSNIMNRYRYHIKCEMESLTASITASGILVTGGNAYLSSSVDTRDYNDIQYTWDFGDGQTATTTSVGISHVYTTAGTFNVSLKKSHPEYGTATATKQVQISPAVKVSVCAKGPAWVDYCSTNGSTFVEKYGTCGTATSTTLIATPTGGCGTITYEWQIQGAGGTWSTFGTTATVAAPAAFSNKTIGTYNVRCIATDSCGLPVTSSVIVLNVLSLCK